MEFTPRHEIRPLIEQGGQIISVSHGHMGSSVHGPLIDSELVVRMPDGMDVRFRPSEFAISKAEELMGF